MHIGYGDQSKLRALFGVSEKSEVKRKEQKLKGMSLCLVGLYKSKTFGGNLMQELWSPVTEKTEYKQRDESKKVVLFGKLELSRLQCRDHKV